jgi:hypothetical protein
VVVAARVAKRPTTQPGQKAHDKDPHPANDEGGEREPTRVTSVGNLWSPPRSAFTGTTWQPATRGQSVGCHLDNVKRERLRTMSFPTKEISNRARRMAYVAASRSSLSAFPSDSSRVRLPVHVGDSRTFSGLTAERPFAGQPLGRACSREVLT